MDKITELTPEQEKLREEYFEEGLRRGRDCTPIDEGSAAPIFGEIYEQVDRKQPEVLYFDSPISCRLAYTFMEQYRGRDMDAWRKLKRSFPDSDLDWDSVYDQIHKGFRELNGLPWRAVWKHGWCLLEGASDDENAAIWKQILTTCKKRIRSVGVGKLFEGQHWLHWHFFYRFCREIGVVFEEKQNTILDIWDKESHLHWWWPYEDVVIACRKPEALRLDPEGRLHSENRPAVEYADGFNLFFWHGTFVPGDWILNPKSVDASLALTWENVEQRRCLSEILGWDKVLEQIGYEEISEDWRGILVEVKKEPLRGERFVIVLCPTDRIFAFPVPARFKTAHDAIAFTYGRNPEHFHPVEES